MTWTNMVFVNVLYRQILYGNLTDSLDLAHFTISCGDDRQYNGEIKPGDFQESLVVTT